MIFRRSPDVPVLNDYRAYRDPYLRPDFQYRCAYCLTHEFYFLQGDGGEIDHYRPLHAKNHDFSHLKNVYGNLYWTCGQCNLEKETFGQAMQNMWMASDSWTRAWKTMTTTGTPTPTAQ